MLGSFRFAPFRDRMLLTNDAGRYAFLTRAEFDALVRDELPQDGECYRMLEERLFCTDAQREVYLRRAIPAVQDNHAYLFEGTSLFIFAVTNRCNQRCTYCQAHGHAALSAMSLETARKAVERIAATPSKAVGIEFQGGEPLTNFAVIREIVRCSKDILKDKRVSYSLVSNLALLDEDKADFLAEHGVAVSTSLDGPQALHDLNRPSADGGSGYARMLRGLNMLRDRGMSVGAIQTTTQASLPHAQDIVQTYAQLGFDSIFLRPLTRLGVAQEQWERIGYEPEDFLAFYRAGLEAVLDLNRQGYRMSESHASIFLKKLLGGYSPNYMELRSPCGAGVGQMAINASGDVYTCDEGRMLAEAGDAAFRLGNVYENGYEEWIASDVCKAVCTASLLETLPGCCDCVYQPYCGVCPVVQYALSGNLVSSQPNNARCRIYRGMLDTLMAYLLEDDPATMDHLRTWINM